MVDAARLADELRAEQDLAMALERDKKLLESQVLISFAHYIPFIYVPSGERRLLKA